jgi:hypothetical protein
MVPNAFFGLTNDGIFDVRWLPSIVERHVASLSDSRKEGDRKSYHLTGLLTVEYQKSKEEKECVPSFS